MLALDPNETFEVRMKSEAELPAPMQSVFTFRYLSASQYRKVNERVFEGNTEAARKVPFQELLKRLCDALRVNMVDWIIRDFRVAEGAKIDDIPFLPYEPGKLQDICTVGELWELFDESRRQSRLDGSAKNESESPSPISTDEPAEATAATAKTPQAPSSP